MITPKFQCTNKNGRLLMNNPEEFKAYLSTLNSDVELIVRNLGHKSRSDNQLRYYWGVVIRMISDETGYTPNEAHEICKALFLSEKLVLHTAHGDQIIDTPKSTTALTTKEMEQYMSEIRMWASCELSLNIPEPNEVEV